MTSSPDLARLRATLGDPRLARLLALLRRRLEQDTPLTGNATLGASTAAERAAIDEMLGRRPSSGASLAIDLDALADALRAAGICGDLADGVRSLLGPIENRRAARETHAHAWAALRDAADRIGTDHPALRSWLAELMNTGVLKRLAQDDPTRAGGLLESLATLARALPAAAEPLPALAARLCGDAHALDPGSPLGTLAVRAAARLGAMAFEDDAEGRRAAWASAGVMCDELSTPALVLNLPASGDTPLGRLLRGAREAGEPLHVSLRLWLKYPISGYASLDGLEVFACENPTIVALAATQLGQRSAPLVCVNGQFATPSLVMLRQLRAAGARVRYHGDFDPAGLAIARRVMAESGAEPWRFDPAAYLAAPKGVMFEGDPGPTPWSAGLGAAMREVRRVVHEEAVFSMLAEDLARGAAPPA